MWYSLIITTFCIDLCLSRNSHFGCEVYGTSLTCNKELNITEELKFIQSIEIYNLNKTTLYLNILLNNYPNLNNLSVAHSSFKKVETKHLRNHDQLKIIRFNNISITTIDETIFSKFKNLELLDLRNNNLQLIHNNRIDHLKDIPTIYLSGNKWNCSKNLEWVYYLNESSVKDLKNLTCFAEPLKGKPLYFISKVTHHTHKDCPTSCKCSVINIFHNSDTEKLQPVVEVNCSKRNFTSFPDFLPKHTKILKLGRNNISDISPLVKNPIYKDVTDLYMDYNFIENMDILEGSYWLRNFRVLSLHDNKLSELPTYAMDNSLQQNPNMPNAIMLYFSNNPWRCDCIFTPSFQEDILVKYASQIQDLSDIKCSYVEGDENSLSPIIELSRSSICQPPNKHSIRALDLLNGILASLIVLVLGKLAYDYYYFKRTGKLPWIVTKMP